MPCRNTMKNERESMKGKLVSDYRQVMHHGTSVCCSVPLTLLGCTKSYCWYSACGCRSLYFWYSTCLISSLIPDPSPPFSHFGGRSSPEWWNGVDRAGYETTIPLERNPFETIAFLTSYFVVLNPLVLLIRRLIACSAR